MRLQRPTLVAASVTAEEVANTIIQGTGTLLSVAGLIVLVNLAAHRGALSVTSVSIYGATLILAFLASTLYHGTWHIRAKRVFQTVDHCAIYALIAGTYTPVALLVLQGVWGWVLAATVWATALLGAVLKVAMPGRFSRLRVVLYLLLGWLIVVWAKPIFEGLGPMGSALLVAGGFLYSVGVVFYRWDKLPFHGPIWHVFVLAASACHFAMIAFYVLPAGPA